MTLPGAVSLANQFSGLAITFDSTVFATPQTITLSGPQQLSDRDADDVDHGPGDGPGDDQRQQPAPGLPDLRRDERHIRQPGDCERPGPGKRGPGVTAGSTAAWGGGVLNFGGNLTFKNVAFTSNSATGGNGQTAQGGAVFSNGGSVTFSNSCTFTSNKAQGGSSARATGGAVYLNLATGSFTSCAFTSNTAQGGSAATAMGGAVYSTNSTVSFTGCTFTSNMAQGGNGGNGAANTAASGTAGSGGAGGDGQGGGVAAEGACRQSP